MQVRYVVARLRFLATVVFCASGTVSMVGSAFAECSTRDLSDILQQLPKDLIEQYEAAREDGRYGDAVAQLELVSESTNVSEDARLHATYRAAALAAQFTTIDVVYGYTTKFQELQGEIGPDAQDAVHGRRLYELDRFRSHLFEKVGRRTAEDATGHLSEVSRTRLLKKHLQLAAAHLHAYINTIDNDAANPPYPVPDVRRSLSIQKLALLHAEIAELAGESGQNDLAESSRQQAVELFQSLRHTSPERLLSNYAGRTYLEVKRSLVEDHDEWLAYAEGLLADMPPGHDILTYLRVFAAHKSNDSESLEHANDLFELIVEYEREWFPDTYAEHINYQVSQLHCCRNLIRLGMVIDAVELYSYLHLLPLQDSYSQDMMNHLAKAFIQYIDGDEVTPREVRIISDAIGLGADS